MQKIIIIILLIVALINICNAQPKNSSLTEPQLLNLQKLSINEINTFLTKEGWSVERNQNNQTREYLDCYLDYKVEKWDQNRTIEWEGTIFIYYKEGVPNLIIYQTIHLNFTNLRPTQVQSIKKNGFETSIFIKDERTMEYREFDNDNSHKRFSILVYNSASLNSLIFTEKSREKRYNLAFTSGNDFMTQGKFEEAITQFELAEKDILPGDDATYLRNETLIQRCKRELIQIIIDNLIKTGDTLFEQKKYDNAISQYQLAREKLLPNDKDTELKIKLRIQKCKRGITQLDFENFVKLGDTYCEQKNYEDALIKYENALTIDSQDNYVVERIKCVKDILIALEIQKVEQSYLKINPTGFADFREINYTAMNSLMKYAKDEGKVSYTAVIKFDNLGNNQSNLIYNSISDIKLKSYLNSINVSTIPPSQISFQCIPGNFWIPAKEVLDFNLSWETNKIKAVVKKQKIAINSTGYEHVINKFIDQQQYKNGNYKFEITEKKMNGVNYEDIKLTSFVYNSGPMKCLYSMLLPGFGTSKVTDGKRGKGRMIFFLLTTAVSIGSKVYSNIQFDKYRNEGDPYKAESYYDNANKANKAFLISGGIAATIYINDILYVFGRGIKNNNKSRNLKKELRRGSIQLVESPLKP